MTQAPDTTRRCARCDGCGRVGSDDEHAPWTFWTSLPPGADLAVQLGIVVPLTCTACDGSGVTAVVSVKRTRQRRAPAAPPPDPVQAEVDDHAAELSALWRVMPAALARDSAGQMSGDRQATGAVLGSPSPANLSVVEAHALIETGLADVAAQAAAILGTGMPGTALDAIGRLPDWHRNLTNAGQPLAKHLRSDLAAWVREAAGALGTRRHDRRLGPDCPHHRADRPTPLLQVGEQARIAASLLAGPPTSWRLLEVGPVCGGVRGLRFGRDGRLPDACAHPSCVAIRERRVLDDRGQLTDWLLLGRPGGLVWSSQIGEDAFTWTRSASIRCPRCKQTWVSTTERRLLARQLAELGDARPDASALMS